jgi:hypothetical protein
VAPVREHVGSSTPVWKYFTAAALHSGQSALPSVEKTAGFAGSLVGMNTVMAPAFPPDTTTARLAGGSGAGAAAAAGFELWQPPRTGNSTIARTPRQFNGFARIDISFQRRRLVFATGDRRYLSKRAIATREG